MRELGEPTHVKMARDGEASDWGAHDGGYDSDPGSGFYGSQGHEAATWRRALAPSTKRSNV